MAIQVFAALAERWDTAITTGVSQTVSTAIQANATQLTVMLTIYIILVGILTAFGRMNWSGFVFSVSRAAVISLLLTATYFNQFIQTPAMETIPTWIAQAVNGGVGATSGPQQFDQLRAAVITHEAQILQQATGLFNIGERIETAMITWFILLELAISFILWEFARGMMGLLIAAAPFLIGFYLFQATRSIALNLAGAAVTILIMQLMLSIMVALELAANNAFMQQAQVGGGIDVQIDTMANIAVFFFFGVVMTLLIPTVATHVGQGVMPNVAGLVMVPARALLGKGK